MPTTRSGRSRTATLPSIAAVALACFGLAGCASPTKSPFQANLYRIDVDISPVEHTLTGKAILDMELAGEAILPPSGPVAFEIELHPDLEITHLGVAGASLRNFLALRSEHEDKQEAEPRTYRVVLHEPVETFTLRVHYHGELHQDVSAGEKMGQVHNFVMKAHIGEEGVYLAGGPWYPQPVVGDEILPRLAEFTLTTNVVPGFEFVAGAEHDAAIAEQTGRLAWRSPYALDGMVLVGGPHEVHKVRHGDIEISVHLKPEQARHAEGLLRAVEGYFDRYEPLLGPYPAREYAVVDNFFSSGFAFPTFTLLSSALIDMGRRAQVRHGMIDHEVTHCWWGNGIFVDPRYGNWCEAFASYTTNYYGYVLDENEEGARRYRRNSSHFLSRMKPERDKPLGTFGLDDGCPRGIGYQKGAMVLHMLARKIGQETFWSAMRRFTTEQMGRYASWNDIRRVFEKESGHDLSAFFRQWVDSAGAPTLTIRQAVYNPDDQTLTIEVSQGDNSFDLDVPIRVTYEGGALDLTVPVAQSVVEASFRVDVNPQSVIIDPDYHIFRKISLDDIVPTTAKTKYGTAFASVVPPGEVNEHYEAMRESFASEFEDDERIALVAGDGREGELAQRCTLILGEAARDPRVCGFLSAIEFPVTFGEDGFEFDGAGYNDPGDAVLCTARHPGVTGGGVTVCFANSEEAVPRARLIPHYSHSLVIFKSGRAMLRRDFEQPMEVMVEHVGGGS